MQYDSQHCYTACSKLKERFAVGLHGADVLPVLWVYCLMFWCTACCFGTPPDVCLLGCAGVLPALLAVQRLDVLDIEGVEPLYWKLLQQMLPGQQMDCCHTTNELQQQQQQQQWLALLRDYLTAATAKDCGIMITLQQIWPAQQPAAAVLPGQCGISSSSSSSSSGGVMYDAASGCTFVWQLSVVDLDLKPLRKIPLHGDLDRRIRAAAAQHSQLLQQHAARTCSAVRSWCCSSSPAATVPCQFTTADQQSILHE
jgi:hypothetical protein